MNGVRAADRLRARFRKPQEAHFAFLNEVRHRADGLFDWRVWIDAMLVIEIDHIHTKPPKTAIARFADVVRLAADAAILRPVRVTQNSEFCRNDDLLAV